MNQLIWNRVLKEFKSGIEECQIKWTQLENKDLKTLDDWSNTIFDAIKKRVNKLKQIKRFKPRQRVKVLDRNDVKIYLENFQKILFLFLQIKLLIISLLSAKILH